jgi:hypothetical protein
VHAKAVAAYCLALASRIEEAYVFAALAHQMHPHYRVDDFLDAFPLSPDGAALFRQGARRIGIG